MTLQELAAKTHFEPRTIRNYIERKLLPPSFGRGKRAGYGTEHLDRLNFIRVVRKEARIPLDDIRRLMQSLPDDQVQRIGRGEEEVRAMSMMGDVPGEHGWDADLDTPSPQSVPYFSGKHAPENEDSTRSPRTWMSAEITDGLELRQRGHDTQDLERMLMLAKRMMHWLEEERGPT